MIDIVGRAGRDHLRQRRRRRRPAQPVRQGHPEGGVQPVVREAGRRRVEGDGGISRVRTQPPA